MSSRGHQVTWTKPLLSRTEETGTGGRKTGKLSQNWESTLQNLKLTANLVRDVASE